MDIKTLVATIQSNFVKSGTLTIPAAGAQSQLQSADLANLITTYLGGTLTITGLDPDPPVPGTLTVDYVGTMSFLGQSFAATATFYLANSPTNGTPEVTLALPLPDDWTFSKTYAPLKDEVVDELTYDQPNFVLESFTNDGSGTFDGLAQGLNFTGVLQSSESAVLSPVNWLLSENLQLTGTLTNWNDPQNTAPTMTLKTSSGATSVTLGSVVLSTYLKASSSYSTAQRPSRPGDTAGPTLNTSVDLVGSLAIGSGTVLTLKMGLEVDPTLLTFSLDSNQLLNSLADLAGFSNGASLSNMIPSQYPLSQILSLDDLTVTVAPTLKKIVNLSFGIRLLQPSSPLLLGPGDAGDEVEIVPSQIGYFSPILGVPTRRVLRAKIDPETGMVVVADDQDQALTAGPTSPTWVIIPNAISINDIYVRFLLADPLNPSLKNIFVKIGATFWIGEVYPIAISISLPSIVIQGYLLPGNTIPLTDVMQHFGLTPPDGFELDVTELSLTANPSYKTYDFSATLDGNVTLFSLNDGKFNLTLTQISIQISVDDTGFSGMIQAYSNFAQVVDFYILAQKTSGENAGWLFKAAITHSFSVGQLIENITGWKPPDFVYNMNITEFSISYETAKKSMTLDVGFQWLFPDLQPYIDEFDLKFHLQTSKDEQTQATLYQGSIEGDFTILGLKLAFIYAFNQVDKTTTYTLKLGKATATFANPDKSGDKVLQVNFGNTTFGDILVFLIKLADPGASSKLDAPWDVLNSISLANLSLTVNFTKNFIEIDYKGTFDLGFITITNVGIRYTRNYGAGQVEVKLQGSFLGQDFGKDNELTWDAMNGQPPAVPGAGTKLFDLQFVGVGQHVTMDTTDLTTMSKAITALEKTVVPLTNTSKNPLEQVGGLYFNSTSNWLVGAEFVVLSTFSVNIVFIDPVLYGLLIKVSGPEASIFEGLSFEILYRKITDDIGVYHIELKLPDVMRHLEFGEVSVTLPIIILDIYTNGNFKIDFGFPISLQNFSNSFALEVFPFVGYGGFYFALLNGATSSRVPKISNGTFNPVIEFGFALSVGVGKTLTIGPLSAGASVTVIGMLQGAFAWFNPNDASTPKALYYWLQGTIAVVGQVYGTIDFVIIKASVSLTVYASITLTIESHKPIIIYMEAGVEVKVSLKILFITLHFSFSAKITMTFTIGSVSDTPWKLAQNTPNPLQMRNQRSLHSSAPSMASRGMPQHFLGLHGKRPLKLALGARPVDAANDPPLTLLLTPLISQAQPTDFIGGTNGPTVVTCNLLLMVQNSVPADARNAPEATVPVEDAAQMPFNILLGKLLTWAIQWIGKDSGQSVTADELDAIHEQLDQPGSIAQLFSYTNLKSFFTNFNVVFSIDMRPTTQPAGGDLSASFFPMFPELTLNVTGQDPIPFWSQNPVNSDYVTGLSIYFEKLMVEYENNVEKDPQQTGQNLRQPKTLAVDDDSPSSMAGYLFSAYFALLAKAVVQNAQDFLASYSYKVSNSANTSLQNIADSFETSEAEYIVRRGDTHDSIAAQFGMPTEVLLRANADLAANSTLAPGSRITVPIPVTTESIITANQSKSGILSNGGSPAFALNFADLVYQVKSGQSFADVAKALTFPGITPVDPTQIISANADQEDLLLVGSSFALPTLTYTGKKGDTVQNVALYFGVPEANVTEAGSLQFTITGATHTVSSGFVVAYALKTGDTLASLAQYFFAPSSKELPLYEQMIQNWNLNTDFTSAKPGTPIQIPYAESLTHLARYYFPNIASAQQLAALAPSVVSQPILAPLATLAISALSYPPSADDTISGVAQKLNLTLLDFTKQIAAQDGVFPDGAILTIPNVPSIKIADLVAGLSTSPLTNSAAVSTSRFLLQGLRLPYPQMTDATYPLYSLTAQQFPNPTAESTISLDITRTVPWLTFANGKTSLPVAFDTQEDAYITSFGTDHLDPQICWLGRLPLYNYQPLHFTVQNALHWQAAELPEGACFAGNGQIVSEPTIWALPATLLGQISQAAGNYLMYNMATSTYIDATSGLQTKPVECYSWATTVNITLRQIPAADGDAASMPNTYLLVGADDVGKQTLFDVMNYLNKTGQTDTALLYLLYPPDPSGPNPKGTASDQLDTANTFLLKTNLSTETHSGAMLFSATPEKIALADAEIYGASIADASDFVTLLWEGSVVKSGGYYLQYTNTGKGALPGYLFTDGNEASITLLVLLNSQIKSGTTGLLPFNNVVVIGDNIDASQSNLFAEPTTYKVLFGDTLQSIAGKLAQYNMDVASLALANQTIQNLLKPGTSLQINSTTPYTIQYGDTFASIAQLHAPATVSGIATASAALAIFTPDALMQLAGTQTYITQQNDTLSHAVQQIGVAGLDVQGFALANQFNLQLLEAGKTLNLTSAATYTIQAGDTLASIALANPPATVQSIALASQGLPILAQGVLAFYGAQQLDMQANVPPGNVGFQMWRSYLDSDPNQQQLNTLFNLLGFKIAGNTYFKTSNEGLPAGPQREPGAKSDADDEGVFYYKQVISAYKSADPGYVIGPVSPALPDPAASPYSGIFADPHAKQYSNLQVDLAFHDLAGNLTEYQFKGKDPDCNRQPTLAPIPVGYTDDLIGLARWPSVSAAFDFPAAKPQLQIDLSFSSTKYLPGFGQSYDGSHQSARAHFENYADLYYQLQEPGLEQFAVTSSLGEVDSSLATRQALQLSLLGFVSQIYLFLDAARSLQQSFPPIAAGTQLSAVAAGYSVSVADLMTANKGVELLGQWFADGTKLNIPTYYIVNTGDTLSIILSHATPAQLQDASNVVLPLYAGADVNIPQQSVQVGTTKAYALVQIAQDLYTSVLNLAALNPTVPLNATVTFTLGGISLPVTPTDTLQSMANSFNSAQSNLNATPASVAVANQGVSGVFSGQTLNYSVHVAQQGDTLLSVVSSYATDYTTLFSLNMSTSDIFPAGTAIYLAGSDTRYSLVEGDTFAVIANAYNISMDELGQRNGSAALLQLNQSADDQYLAIPNMVEFPSKPPTQYSSYITKGGSEAMSDIIGKYAGWDAAGFVTLNQDLPGLFAPTQLPNTQITPRLTDTITTLAQQLSQTPLAFVQTYQGQANISRPGALLLAPQIQTKAGDTLSGVAQTYNITSPLALAQANGALKGLLQSPQTLNYTYTPPDGGTPVNKQYTVGANDTLVTVVGQFNGLFSLTTLTLEDILAQNPNIEFAANQALLSPVVSAQLPPLAVTLADSYPDPVFQLAVDLQMLRDQNRVDPDFLRDTSVFSNVTPIPPAPLANAGSALSLKTFAANFETAFGNVLKLGTGDVESAGASSKRQLWVVNFDPARNGIEYKANPEQIQFFALQPLSNQLWTMPGVTVPTYTSGSALAWTQKQNFQDIDLDAWLSSLLAAIDLVLSPAYAIPSYLLGATAQGLITDILTYKETIALGLRDLVDFLLNNRNGDLSTAKEALYQQALVSLSSVYDTTVMLQYPFTVKSPFSDAASAPLISGKPLAIAYVASDGTVTNDAQVVHQLQSGDTFVSIANQLGVTVIDLIVANQDVPDVFEPTSTVTVFVDGNKVTVTADKGDTIAKIAGKVYNNQPPTSQQIQDFAVQLWTCDLTGSQGGCSYTLYTNPPVGEGPTSLQVFEVMPVASFTTGKLPLSNGQSTVTFLLSVKDPQQRRMAYFNLEYAINELEYNIQSLPAAVGAAVGQDYRESSWLAFINPIDTLSLGQAQVPIPLRVYPNAPLLSQQQAVASHPDSDNLDEAKQWNYEFNLDYQNAAQDSMELGIFFNRLSDQPPPLPSAQLMKAQDNTALYQALAAFATVYAPVKDDLALLLTDPTNKNVLPALQAFHDLVKKVNDAWSGQKVELSAIKDDDGEIHWYQFSTIIDEQTPDQYQFLVLDNDEATPLWPTIDQATPTLQLPSEVLYSYTDPISQPLNLDFAFDELDVLQRQNGWSGIAVTRNQNLLGSTDEAKQTNQEFIYQTPLALFASKITPYVLIDTPLPLTTTNPPDVTHALGDFFTVLFDKAPSNTSFLIKVSSRFAYALVEGETEDQTIWTTLPLILNPLASFNPATDIDPSNPQSFVSLFSKATLDAASAAGANNIPSGVTRRYLFDVSIYSSLQTSGGGGTVPSKPILDIRNRYWQLSSQN